MIDPNQRYTDLVNELKENGYRMTPQRMEVVRVIAASDGHPSATQIFETVKNQFPTMSQATVYNTIALLKEMNQILEIDLHGDSHYDGNRPEEHSHLICKKCSRIVDADFDVDKETISRLENTSGYKIIRSQVAFYGFCPVCKSSG
jgi:Fur family peroxide stress response transcriptional regulator